MTCRRHVESTRRGKKPVAVPHTPAPPQLIPKYPTTPGKMRTSLTLAVAAFAGSSVWAFAPPTSLRPVHKRSDRAALSMVYIPDGLSAEEWKKIQAKEKAKAANLGRVGVVRFKSRSFQAWQEAGAGHLFPVDPKKVKLIIVSLRVYVRCITCVRVTLPLSCSVPKVTTWACELRARRNFCSA